MWKQTTKDLKRGNYSSLDQLKKQVNIIIKSLTNEEVLSLCGCDYILEAIYKCNFIVNWYEWVPENAFPDSSLGFYAQIAGKICSE
ncbi:hypothetical protein C7B69_07170 [filamentous cyanobacterium Phorm 46]|nr:hypothetical protein C7B69_07170 [filamentous cyanobacterium Phorm 46]PSB40196.1 hypothetical protein C7B67_28815 [filamentous cyanobacterium Phorm 6]